MSPAQREIITEITPLSDKDCFYFIDRYKDRFNYPIHRHEDYELNFVGDAAGASRVVGDSVCEIGPLDLVLVGHNIEHCWEQGKCSSPKIHEMTLQFSKKLFGDTFLSKNQMAPIKELLERSGNGIAFSHNDILRVYHLLDELTKTPDNFQRMLLLMRILYELANSTESVQLSSSSFAQAPTRTDSRRVLKVQEYIDNNYKDEIRLSDLADLVGMTPTAFSRFFKLRTGRHVSEYIIDVRLGHATRALVDSTHSISEISFECGFNNISYFNRIFKKRKGCSPKEFRELYKRNRLLV
ncbi:AraC family transcriptional regulator [Lepagella muris]|jgi:AraC-like DNA-binding protein|uniref:AraC family transcriptional regulator n=1 Tax=Lepagella muris TaxID=3032870 RepID=A0AC61RDP6_9BACT|nr:AraC family transcriptional regulator [Lepagella muris]ROT08682.1 AraC family transcriptional regulator [Muribaculaceae bacterium Isolate-037 (Harlan)]TGY77710.1 AraC family transcriptional regulator [Lepagella muris]THG50653.1 helix-turn-helix transcriptional regulator [Bacteroidales bacterium]TKC55926.1 helix-turn-helix transcriptional regulator [Bacteroidales bacterium]